MLSSSSSSLSSSSMTLVSFCNGLTEDMSKLLPHHPRLLMNDDELASALNQAKTDVLRERLHRMIISKAEEELITLPAQYILSRFHKEHGPDIKKQIRTATPRVLGCSMAYRLTRDKRFLDRAVLEMKAVAAFPNWHPVLMLGTAELATIVSIGYDWLYNDMLESDRLIIADALYRHCLSMAPAIYRMILLNDSDLPGSDSLINEAVARIGGENNVYLQCGDGGVGQNENPFKRNTPFVTNDNNWNQVCNCGLVAVAVALADKEPALAKLAIVGAVRSLPIAMNKLYGGDGCYPEGPQYWSHGTTCNAMAIGMLQSSMSTDFGLSNYFNHTLRYRIAQRGPTSLSFNYADASADLFHDAAVSWLSKLESGPMRAIGSKYSRLGLQEMLDYLEEGNVKESGKKKKEKDRTVMADRFYGLHAVWFPDYNDGDVPMPDELLNSRFDGNAQLAIFRSDWGKRALYAAIKSGTNDQSHGHLDLGTFIIDANGVRFAMELGKDDYGLRDYNSRNVKSPRWNKYMRTNNWGHNTISVDGFSDGGDTNVKYALQDILGRADIIGFKSTPNWAHAIVDLSFAYPYHRIRHKNKEMKEEKLKKASRSIKRGLAMIDRSVLLVQDEIVLTDSSNGKFSHKTDLIWRMFTSAKVTLMSKTVAVLESNSEMMKVEILTPIGLMFSTSSADPRVLYHDIDINGPKHHTNDDKDNNDKEKVYKDEDKRLRRLAKGKLEEERNEKVVIEQENNDGVTLLVIESLDCLSSNIFESARKEVTSEFMLSVLFTPIPPENKDSVLTYKSSNNIVIKPLHAW